MPAGLYEKLRGYNMLEEPRLMLRALLASGRLGGWEDLIRLRSTPQGGRL